jgi:hypothetical protein
MVPVRYQCVLWYFRSFLTVVLFNLGQTGLIWGLFSSERPFSDMTAYLLDRAQRRFLGYRDNFVDGTETFYSERSQAWRLLGVYIDCDAQDNNNDDHKDRKLSRNTPAGGLKQPQEEEEADSNKKLEDVAQCQRYMLWAGVSPVETFVVEINESHRIVVRRG